MQSRDAATPLWKEEELPDLHPICFLLCQTAQIQGIAIHFLTPPSSKHLSITNLNSSCSVWEWQAKINQLIYLNCLAHIAKPVLSHRKPFLQRGRMCCDPFTHLIQKEWCCSGFMANLTESPAAITPARQEHPMGNKAPVPCCGQGLCSLCCIHPLLQDKFQMCLYAFRL